jgi:hypothetical protein
MVRTSMARKWMRRQCQHSLGFALISDNEYINETMLSNIINWLNADISNFFALFIYQLSQN